MSKKLAFVAVLGGLVGTAAADPNTPTVPGLQPTPSTTELPGEPTTPPPGTATDVPSPVATDPAVVVPVATETPVEPVAPVAVDAVVVPSEEGDIEVSTYAWSDPWVKSGIGVGFTVGGGVSGFTDKTLRDSVRTDVSGIWDARLSIGTHIPLGLELGYVGSAVNVNTLAGTPNGTLVGSAAEAAVRWNIVPHELITPFVFGGIGWQHYNLTDRNLASADSGMDSHDSFWTVPMGIGLSMRQDNGFTFDARGTYRAAITDSTLVVDRSGVGYATPNSWEASANLGYEF